MWKFSELEYKRPDVDELVKLITDTTEAVKNAGSGEEVLELQMLIMFQGMKLEVLIGMLCHTGLIAVIT